MTGDQRFTRRFGPSAVLITQYCFQASVAIKQTFKMIRLTFSVQLGTVLGKTLKAHPFPQQLQELFEGGTCCLIIVHLLLAALAGLTVHDSHFQLEAELHKR